MAQHLRQSIQNKDKDSKLLWFQYRINHRILTTNTFLKKINISDDPLCSFCHDENETLEHLFWHCSNTQNLLRHLKQLLYNMNISFNVEMSTFILCSENNLKESHKRVEKIFV